MGITRSNQILPRTQVDTTEANTRVNYEQYPKKVNLHKDILPLIDLVNKIEDNLKIQSELKDKDLALILGQIGTGKSLLINKLSGLNIIEDGYELKLEQPQNAISSFGDQMKAQTKKIFFMPSKNKNTNQTLYICDTPGLLDDQGFQDDIINSFIILKAIENSKSIRFILMFTPQQCDMTGRGEQFKKLVQQYSQFLTQIEKYEDSIILSLNYIKSNEEQTKVNEALHKIGRIKNILQDDELSKKTFTEMIIKKLEQKQYFIFDPLQRNDYLNYLKKIHSLRPINKNDIKNYIKYSLNENSCIQLDNFLRKCIDTLKDCIKKCDYESSTQIIKAFAILQKNVDLVQVKQQCEKLVDEIISQENIVETLFTNFENFCKIELFDLQWSESIVLLIKKILNVYLLIEQVKQLLKEDIQMKNSFQQINSYLKKMFFGIFDLSKNSNDIQYKLIQLQKLTFLLENNELKNTYEIICYKIKSFNIEICENVFSTDLQQKISRDIEQNYQLVLDEINEIKLCQNVLKCKNIKVLLNNIKFISENNQSLKLKIRKNYQELKTDFQQIISQFILEIKFIDISTNKDFSYNNLIQKWENDLSRSKIMIRKYKFIQFFCSSENTVDHFQDNETKKLFLDLKECIKQTTIQFYVRGVQIQNFDDNNQILPIHRIISDLSNLDDIINKEINNNQYYIQYQTFLSNFYLQKKQNFEESFQNLQNQISTYLNDNKKDTLPQQFSENIEKNVKDLFQIRNLIQEIPKYQLIQNEYKECEKVFEEYIYKLQDEIQQILYEDSKFIINFKRLQVLVYFNKGYNALVPENRSGVFDIYNKQVQFIKTLSRWMSQMINTQNIITPKEISLQNLNEINENILIQEESLQFFINFKELLVPHIQLIQQKLKEGYLLISQINLKDEDILEKQVKHQSINQNDTSFINNIDQEIEKIKNCLIQIQDELYNKFQQDFQVNLKTFDGLFEVKQLGQIKRLLDKLKDIQFGSMLKVKELIGENKYNEVQTKVKEYLKNQLEMIGYMRINNISFSFNQYNTEFNSLKNNMELIKEHISPNNMLDIEAEEFKIKALSQKLNDNAVNLLAANNFKDACSFMKSLDDSMQKQIIEQLKQRMVSIIENIGSYINRFEKEFSFELQDEIMRNVIIASDVFKYFNANNSNGFNTHDERIQTHFMNYANKLVDKLFLSFGSPTKIDKVLIKTMFLTFNQNLNRIKFDINIFNQHLQRNIYNKFQEVKRELQCESFKQNIIESANTLIEIHNAIKELNLEYILKNKEIDTQFNELKECFLRQINQQTERFIHQQYNYDSKDIQEFIISQYQFVFNFFMNKKDQVNKFIKTFIKSQQEKFNNFKKDIQNRNIKNLKNFFLQHPDSKLINHNISYMLYQIEQNIICIYLPQHDFNQIKTNIKILQDLRDFFQIKGQEIIQNIQSIEINITNQIFGIWTQFKNQIYNLVQNRSSILFNIVKISNIIDLCDIEIVKKEINYRSLIDLVTNSVTIQKDQIYENINILNYDSTIKLFIGLKNIQKEEIVFQKKKRNYFEILIYIIDQHNSSQKYNKQKALIQDFQKKLLELFKQQIEIKKLNITDSLQQQYRSKQYEKIIEEQIYFNEFTYKLNQIQEFIERKDYYFIFEYIEKNYKDEYEKAHQISRNQVLKLQEINRILILLEELELHFSCHSKKISDNLYSKQVKIIFEEQLKIMIENAKSLIKNFKEEKTRKNFVKCVIEIFVSADQQGSNSIKLEIRNLISQVSY